MDEPRMVALVQQYGAERILVNSAADWGVSRSAQGAEDARRDARGRHRRRDASRRSSGSNPVAFFAQSGRLDRRSSAPVAVDQRELHEGNSVLRGQAPRVDQTRRDARTLVLNVVGLTPDARRRAHAAPRGARARGRAAAARARSCPAVTCTVQSTFTTGLLPREHGCVANGWYFRDIAEVALWRQSNAARRRARRSGTPRSAATPSFTCAKLFWWFNMYSTADFAVTPRPMYPADGRKLPDIHTHPAALRDELQARARHVPAVQLLGPARRTSRASAVDRALRAIDVWQRAEADAAPSSTCRTSTTTCSASARTARASPATLRAIDAAVRRADRAARRRTARASSCCRSTASRAVDGADPRSTACCATRGPARGARRAGPRAARRGRVRGVRRRRSPARARLRQRPRARSPRSRQLLARSRRRRAACSTRTASARTASTTRARASSSPIARARPLVHATTTGSTTTRAPDFARTVDIHRKPGYDPVELFVDPGARRAAGRTVGVEARAPQARLPHAARRHPARHVARQGLARPPAGSRTPTGRCSRRASRH